MLALASLLMHCTLAAEADHFASKAGVQVIVLPTPRATRAAVVGAYRGGLLADPNGMPQAGNVLAHTLFHAVKGSAPETVRNLLDDVNASGAEVLGDAMIFEQLVPLHLLEAGLQVEAHRLMLDAFTPATVQLAARECSQEIQAAEVDALAHKFAVAAWSQLARFQLGAAYPKTTPAKLDAAALYDAYARRLQAGKTLIVVASPRRVDEVRAMIERAFAEVAPLPAARSEGEIAWDKVPGFADVAWDLACPFVVLAWPAVASDDADAPALFAAASALQQALADAIPACYAELLTEGARPPLLVVAPWRTEAERRRFTSVAGERMAQLVSHPERVAARAHQLADNLRDLATGAFEETDRFDAGLLLKARAAQAAKFALALGADLDRAAERLASVTEDAARRVLTTYLDRPGRTMVLRPDGQ